MDDDNDCVDVRVCSQDDTALSETILLICNLCVLGLEQMFYVRSRALILYAI